MGRWWVVVGAAYTDGRRRDEGGLTEKEGGEAMALKRGFFSLFQ